MNCIDWLAQDEALISIRSKGISDRPIKELSKGGKTALRYLNMLFPSIVLIGIGMVRWRKRRRLT
jgi:ABC-type uncharacterized transport system involved in gliding motility auxiliary subunit